MVQTIDLKKKNVLTAGHRACAGCGEALGARLALEAAHRVTDGNIVVTNATGCLEVFSTPYPYSSWTVPWIHSLFENSAAVASGIEAGLKVLGKADKIKVIAQGGDGGTADIGFGALSGMLERGHDVLYICYDNEAYMNTGIQRSGLTPLDASTTTSPFGERSWGNDTHKKDLPHIVAAHGAPYVATATVGYPRDLQKKVEKAMTFTGPKYIQIHVPCPLGWRHDSSLTIEIAQLAVQTGLYPLYEIEKGELKRVKRIKAKPVEEYLRLQGRFRHLFTRDNGQEEIRRIQAIADENIRRFGLVRSSG
ncbi:MAG: thiamine pyrophosphate-dependent enzyme [Anaerolineae bacterium]